MTHMGTLLEPQYQNSSILHLPGVTSHRDDISLIDRKICLTCLLGDEKLWPKLAAFGGESYGPNTGQRFNEEDQVWQLFIAL